MFSLAKPAFSSNAATILATAVIALHLSVMPVSAQSNFTNTRSANSVAKESKTYLVNGLVSAIPFIGYGMANLNKRIDGARLFSYVSPIEGTAVIQPSILREIRSLYQRNPDIHINLIGISYGASMVTAISARLAKDNIPVNYLGVIDGRPLTKIYSNVRRVDNFTCSFIDCIGARLKIANGNNSTHKVAFRFRSSHIALGNNDDMHNRIIQQISNNLPFQVGSINSGQLDRMPVSAIALKN